MLDSDTQITRRQLAWRIVASLAVFAIGIAMLGLFATPVGAAPSQQDRQTADAVVNVAHFAPFGDSQEGTSVSVFVDSAEAIPNLKFGDVAAGVSLSSR